MTREGKRSPVVQRRERTVGRPDGRARSCANTGRPDGSDRSGTVGRNDRKRGKRWGRYTCGTQGKSARSARGPRMEAGSRRTAEPGGATSEQPGAPALRGGAQKNTLLVTPTGYSPPREDEAIHGRGERLICFIPLCKERLTEPLVYADPHNIAVCGNF